MWNLRWGCCRLGFLVGALCLVGCPSYNMRPEGVDGGGPNTVGDAGNGQASGGSGFSSTSHGGSSSGALSGSGSSRASSGGTSNSTSHTSGSGGTCSVSGEISCGGNCVNPQTDATFCGATQDCQGPNAGTECVGGKTCTGGTCATTCPGSLVLCHDAATDMDVCVNPATSQHFCGASLDCGVGHRGVDCGTGGCVGGACTTGGTITCPASPAGTRILQNISLTASVSGTTGAFTVRWTVVTEPQANSLALQGADSVMVTFNPIIRGDYKLRATLTQTGIAAAQSCDVAFTVAGPTAAFNAQLLMTDAVDVDLHLLHPVGQAHHARVNFATPAQNFFYFEFNWGPVYHNAALGPATNLPQEVTRMMPDCNFYNCDACTVQVPGQGACTNRTLAWNSDTTVAPFYAFVNGTPGVTSDANPKLDIDNRRGCYADALGMRVCTPENISMKLPGPLIGDYTVAVHYWGDPLIENPVGVFSGNHRGTAPAGLDFVNVDVEVYCVGVGYQKFHCAALPVDGWCFVATASWNGSQCTTITPVANLDGSTPFPPSFPQQLVDMTAQNPSSTAAPQWDAAVTRRNILATPVP